MGIFPEVLTSSAFEAVYLLFLQSLDPITLMHVLNLRLVNIPTEVNEAILAL